MEKKGALHLEIKGLLIFIGNLLLVLSLLTFVHGSPEASWLGIIGYGIGLTLMWTVGLSAYLLLGYIGWIGWKMMMGKTTKILSLKTLYLFLGMVSLSMILNLLAEKEMLSNSLIQSHLYSEVSLSSYPFPHKVVRFHFGGVPLYYLLCDLPLFNLQHLLSNIGVFLIFSLTGLMSLLLFTNTHIIPLSKSFTPYSNTLEGF